MKKKKKLQHSLLLSVAVASLCSCREGAKVVSFADVCREENHALVALEGYIRLPALMEERGLEKGSRQLLLVEKENGTGGFLPVMTQDSETKEPNRIAHLPLSYTYKDLRIYTEDGSTVTSNDRLRVTGEVVKDLNSCVLKIQKIETRHSSQTH